MYTNHNDIVNALIAEAQNRKFQKNFMEAKLAALEQQAIQDGDTAMHALAGQAFVLLTAGEWQQAEDVLRKMLQ